MKAPGATAQKWAGEKRHRGNPRHTRGEQKVRENHVNHAEKGYQEMAEKKKKELELEQPDFIAYLTSSQVAKMAGVKVPTVNSALAKGDLHPASRTGTTWGYLEPEVRRWMKWREQNPPQSRAWGWNNSGTPRPHGVAVKGSKKQGKKKQ